MSDYLTTLFHDTPVLVAPGQEKWLAGCINGLQAKIDSVGAEQIRDWAGEALSTDDWWGGEGSLLSILRPYKVTDGVLNVPVRGMLLHNFPFAAFSFATGYEYIVKAFERGLADPDVKAIAMLIDSGGGQVAGAFDATDKLYNMRGRKPMHALVNEHAYSAAYSLATAMDRVILPRTGGVGSVGVVTSHVSYAKALEEAGIEVTFIHAGAHKVDGHPYAALSEETQSRIQARIDGIHTIFVTTVARNLGLSPEAVRQTEALTFSAEEAVRVGFAHSVQAIDEATAALGGPHAIAGEVTMSQQAEQEPQIAVDQAGLDAARAEGRQEGAQQERERIKGILGSEAAKSRDGLAQHLAMNTDMSVEACVSVLEASPVEQTEEAASGSHFEAAMSTGNPNISTESDEGQAPQGEDLVSSILADYHAVAGKPQTMQ